MGPEPSVAVPTPGSAEAVDLGCTCPVMDNARGKGRDGLFWVNADCPLHSGNGRTARRAALSNTEGGQGR